MYLGIDLGTSEVKTILVDDAQRVRATARAPLQVDRPRPGFSEQDPESWWQAVTATLDELHGTQARALAAVRGIGLSGQMHGATLLDGADRPLRPCILWNDGRAAAECAELDAAADFRGIAGNLVMPGFTAPKLRWVERHEPEVFREVRRVLLPKDYIRLRLTGEAVSEMSDAAGTLWLDTALRRWSPALLAATHLDERHMPRLVEGSAPSGRLRADLATRWGMTSPPVVAGGASDNAASACGIGAVMPGGAFLSLGTSGVLFVATDRFRPNVERAVHAFCHAVPDTWHQMAVILAAADSLAWWARQVGARSEELTAALGERPAAPSPALFFPYLGGERTPHNDVAVRGAFAGLGHEADRAALTQAVLEGVAFAFKDGLDALAAAGSTVETVTAVGGGARSSFWLAVLASVLERPIRVPAAGEVGAALGAARLAMAAAGEGGRTLFAPAAFERTIEPEPALAAAYGERLDRWRALYPSLRALAD